MFRLIKLKDIPLKKICRECLYLFYKPSFIYRLDRNINLICFNNGVWNMQNKTFRNGERYLIYYNYIFMKVKILILLLINLLIIEKMYIKITKLYF